MPAFAIDTLTHKLETTAIEHLPENKAHIQLVETRAAPVAQLCDRCKTERGYRAFRLCFFCMQETVWHPANAKITATAQLQRKWCCQAAALSAADT